MSIQEMYQAKLTTANEAVKVIQSGDGIIFPIMPGEPESLLDGIRVLDTLEDNRLYRMLPSFPIVDAPKEKLKQISIFLSGMDRKQMNSGLVDLLPNNFSDIPSILKQREEGRYVIMATVSPMDAAGNFSFIRGITN